MSSIPQDRYRESVLASRWLMAAIALAAVAAFAGAVATLRSEDEHRGATAVMLAAILAVLIAVALCFARLRIATDGGTLRFRFGPFGPTLDASEIRSVEVTRYRWLAFGGWGIRFGRIAGHRATAYSVPFLRSGVTIETANGKRYYVSSRQPESLAEAIGRLTAAREGQV
jgi:hypothetical protein